MALKFFVLLLCAAVVAGREIPAASPGHNLVARMEGAAEDGMLLECRDVLKELIACSNEILLFLIKGKAKLGPPCCLAVETITRGCWPAMLTAAGISSEEGNIFRGYCDKEVAATGPATSPVQYSNQ